MALTLRLLALLLAVPSIASASAPPTRAALRRALEADEGAAVKLERSGGGGRGTLISANGQILTLTEFLAPEERGDGADPGLHVRWKEQSHAARVLSADALSRLAMVQCEALDEGTPVVASPSKLRARGWVIAVIRHGKRAEPRAVLLEEEASGALRVRAVPVGTPLYDDQGRLIGLVTEKRPRGARVLPVSELRDHVRRPIVAGDRAPAGR